MKAYSSLFYLFLSTLLAISGDLSAQTAAAESRGSANSLLIILYEEMVKSVPDVLLATATISLSWFVGKRLSLIWALRQKKRELDVAMLGDFYRIYGEFFSVWKLWNYYLKKGQEMNPPADTRWEILDRATAVEADLEAILLKISAERELLPDELETLGKFRQGFQSLREAVRDNENLGWFSSDHSEYQTFKNLACRVIRIISPELGPKTLSASHHALHYITSDRWKLGSWVDD